MYYFKYNDTIIEKYIVRFNRDELIKLRRNIINNCKELVHREIDSDVELTEELNMMNFKKIHEGDKYHYSYDEYVYPRLALLIDMLLRSDDRAIEKLYSERSNDINSLIDEKKKLKLSEYYNCLDKMLSFELLVIIDFNENDNVKRRPKKVLKKRV